MRSTAIWTDQRRLADDRRGAGQRLHRADPVWLALGQREPQRQWRQHSCAKADAAAREHPAPGWPAGSALLVLFVSHLRNLLRSALSACSAAVRGWPTITSKNYADLAT
jgi:hypothetical protein